MIIKEIFYAVKCDRCGEVHDDEGIPYWSDESTSVENAYDSGWEEVNGRHYCPNCFDIDEETDEVEVYEEYPTHLKVLNRFVDKLGVGINRQVLDGESEFFTVRFNTVRNRELEQFEIDYLKALMGEKFVSVDYEEVRHNTVCCIKLHK